MSRTTLLFCRWLITAFLVICLPLQAVSASVAVMLGPRHSHQEFAVTPADGDPMMGWRDFRRVQHDHLVEVSGSARSHARTHASGARHHHAMDDRSVVKEDLTAFEDGSAADGGQASAAFVFLAAPGAAGIAPPIELFGDAWLNAVLRPPGDPSPSRIERPPQAAAPQSV